MLDRLFPRRDRGVDDGTVEHLRRRDATILERHEARDAEDIAKGIGILHFETFRELLGDPVQRHVREALRIRHTPTLEHREKAPSDALVGPTGILLAEEGDERAPSVGIERRGPGHRVSLVRESRQSKHRPMRFGPWAMLAIALTACPTRKTSAPADAIVESKALVTASLSTPRTFRLSAAPGSFLTVEIAQRSVDVAVRREGEAPVDRARGARGRERFVWRAEGPGPHEITVEKAFSKLPDGAFVLSFEATATSTLAPIFEALRALETSSTATIPVAGGDAWLEAQTAIATGERLWSRRQVAPAKAAFGRAIALGGEGDRPDVVALARIRLGGIAYFEGELEDAEQRFAAARVDAERARADGLVVEALVGSTAVRTTRSRHESALEVGREAEAIAARIGADFLGALARDVVGTIHHRLGEAEPARQRYEAAFAAFFESNHHGPAGRTLHKLGLLAREVDEDPRAAIAAFERSLPLLERGNSVEGQALVHLDLGLTYHLIGERDRARAALERGLDLASEYGIKHVHARASWGLGVVAEAAGDLEDAQRRLHTARALFEQVEDAIYEARAEASLARIALATDDGDPLRHARRSVELAESVRARVRAPDLRTSAFADVRSHYDLLLELEIDAGADASASLELSERARARALVESLLRAHVSRIEVAPKLSIAALKRRMGPRRVLLEYFLGDRKSWLWVVGSEGVVLHSLPPRAAIEDAVRAWREAVEERLPDELDRGRALSKMILGPVVDDLGSRNLWIVPDGALHFAPWPALPRGDRRLVETHVLRLIPSATLVAARANRPEEEAKDERRQIALIADPIFSAADARLATPDPDAPVPYGRLGFTRSEATAIEKLAGQQLARFVGLDANVEAVTRALPHHGIIHFATHTRLDAKAPERAALILSLVDAEGRPRRGDLRLADIYGLDLDAELVVLSACETALGPLVRGEGLLGLSRGFLFAGSRSVAASLWRIDDRATFRLMSAFYEGLLKRGESPASALRAAQRSMLAEQRFSHPRDWSGFVVVGRE